MIIELKRWIAEVSEYDDEILSSIDSEGEFVEFKIRLDKVEGYGKVGEELVLIIGGCQNFFNFDERAYRQIDNYFKMINTTVAN